VGGLITTVGGSCCGNSGTGTSGILPGPAPRVNPPMGDSGWLAETSSTDVVSGGVETWSCGADSTVAGGTAVAKTGVINTRGPIVLGGRICSGPVKGGAATGWVIVVGGGSCTGGCTTSASVANGAKKVSATTAPARPPDRV